MQWLSLLSAMLRLFNYVAQVVANKQMMDAGEAKLVSSIITSSLERIDAAKTIRTAGSDAPTDVVSMQDDVFDRSKQTGE